MREIKNSLIDKIMMLGILYSVGTLLAFLFKLFQALGVIRISHRERLPNHRLRPDLYSNGLMVISNHPSLLEPGLLPLLFHRDYISHPFRLRPISTPDKANYFDRWYWHWLLKFLAIPIDRNSQQERARACVAIRKVLTSGGIVILFPEGGRTFKGEVDKFHYSKSGKRIRALKEGVGLLISKTNTLVLPIWVDGAEEVLPNSADRLYYAFPRFWKSVTIKIGEPMRFPNPISREEITQTVITTLLKLADEPG